MNTTANTNSVADGQLAPFMRVPPALPLDMCFSAREGRMAYLLSSLGIKLDRQDENAAAYRAALKCLTSFPSDVADWKVVPLEPTAEMCKAGQEAIHAYQDSLHDIFDSEPDEEERACLTAMIAAWKGMAATDAPTEKAPAPGADPLTPLLSYRQKISAICEKASAILSKDCSCATRSLELQFHEPECHYRLGQEIFDLARSLSGVVAARVAQPQKEAR